MHFYLTDTQIYAFLMHMNATLTLPPVPLNKLREKTKDYLLGLASANQMTPEQVIERVLDRAADAQLPPPVVNSPEAAQSDLAGAA
jgi:hypothetical protein